LSKEIASHKKEIQAELKYAIQWEEWLIDWKRVARKCEVQL